MESTLNGASTEAIQLMETFWPRVTKEIQNLTSSDFKNPELPLARIKKIMKLDDEVKMISAEAPIIFAKASELFIQEVTIRAWLHTEENKRRTLQRNDVHLAISKYDQFDFLIDIVPREEKVKPPKSQKETQQQQQASFSPTTGASQSSMQNASVMSAIDQANLFNGLINGNGAASAVTTSPTAQSNGNAGAGVQYYFALPSNGLQNGGAGGIPINLSGLQTIQGLPGNIQGLQTIQGLQSLQGLQGAQIILNSNGQPTIFSVGNRDC